MSETLLARWRKTAGSTADALGLALIGAYCEPQRRYHDISHVEWLLDEAERRAAIIADAAFVGYAIWFHDAIYVPGMPDNEARSAVWAREAVAGDPRAEHIAHVIEMTKAHAEGEASGDEALFLDMDMAIIGAPWEAYCAYAAGIRAEYPHIPDSAFAAGRGAWLAAQLATPRLFRTAFYQDELTAQARANLAWEMGEMRYGRMVRG